MEEDLLPPPRAEDPAPAAPVQPPTDTGAADSDGYEPVTTATKEAAELRKDLEPQVYEKVVSDMDHVVLAYGVILALFAVYGLFLWRRSQRLRADLDALRARMKS